MTATKFNKGDLIKVLPGIARHECWNQYGVVLNVSQRGITIYLSDGKKHKFFKESLEKQSGS